MFASDFEVILNCVTAVAPEGPDKRRILAELQSLLKGAQRGPDPAIVGRNEAGVLCECGARMEPVYSWIEHDGIGHPGGVVRWECGRCGAVRRAAG